MFTNARYTVTGSVVTDELPGGFIATAGNRHYDAMVVLGITPSPPPKIAELSRGSVSRMSSAVQKKIRKLEAAILAINPEADVVEPDFDNLRGPPA